MNASQIPASPEWLPFLNTTTEVIPAGAVLEPAGGYDATGRIRVRKCTAANVLGVFFNGPMAVEAASSGGTPDEDKPGGLCRTAGPLTAVAIHPDDVDALAVPVAVGTVAGDWYLRVGGSGFRVIDPPADGLANAVPDPPGRVPACTGDIVTWTNDTVEVRGTNELWRVRKTITLRYTASGCVEAVVGTATDTKLGTITAATPPGVVRIGECTHDYPATLYGEIVLDMSTCTCLAGAVTLAWDGDAWTGTHTACGVDVTVRVRPVSESGGTITWSLDIFGGGYEAVDNAGSLTATSTCGDLPGWNSFDVTGPSCSGSHQFNLSETP